MAFTALLMAIVSALYGTAGQAGGSGFVAVMTLRTFPIEQIRPTAFALNVAAAAYATFQVVRAKAVDWTLFRSIAIAALPAAFAGGLIALTGPAYLTLTASLLALAAVLMLFRVSRAVRELSRTAALVAGGSAGFASGITGVGGGVYLSAILILVAGVCPKQTAALSPPFILVNSVAALAGTIIAGQRVPVAVIPFAVAALLGSAIGSAVGLRFMTARAIRAVLAAILFVGAGQMLIRALWN